METRIFLLADYANVDAARKLNIIGAFNTITVGKVPALHPSMYVVARISAGLGEYGIEQEFNLILFDEDASEILRAGGSFTFPQPGSHQLGSEFNLIISLQNLSLARAGRYEFRLLISEHLMGVAPLDVVLVPA